MRKVKSPGSTAGGFDFYAFTAPAVKPSMKLFIKQRNSTISGSAVTT